MFFFFLIFLVVNFNDGNVICVGINFKDYDLNT